MKKIDTREWKRFRIGTLFRKCETTCRLTNFSKAMDLSTEKTDEFSLPLVNAMHFNNGIMYYGREDDWDFEEMTLDIVADGAASTGDVYAQPQKTGVLYNAYLIKPLATVSERALRYLATIIRKCVKDDFGYEQKCTWNKIKDADIMLPVAIDGSPDWQYMDCYMRNIETAARKTLSLFSLATGAIRELHDTSAWKQFQIKKLFRKCELDCRKEDFNKAFDLSTEKIDEFNLPLVNAMHFHNGIMYYGREDDWDSEEMTLDIVSNGAIATGDVFAQPQRTGVLWDAYLVKPYHEVSEHTLKFLATVLQKCVKDYFDYNNKCTWNKVREKYVSLPVDADGNPDWKYMEDCVRREEIRARAALDCFSSQCAANTK